MKFAIIGSGKIGTALARLRAFGNQSRNLQYPWAEDPRGLGANDFRIGFTEEANAWFPVIAVSPPSV